MTNLEIIALAVAVILLPDRYILWPLCFLALLLSPRYHLKRWKKRRLRQKCAHEGHLWKSDGDRVTCGRECGYTVMLEPLPKPKGR